MKCPHCGESKNRVVDSRGTFDDLAVRRRRECEACGHRFTTYEAIETHPLQIVKKDGTREPFDRQKVMAGVLRACWKRPVSTEAVEGLVAEVERELARDYANEVPSTAVGERVMEKLRDLDKVAYVRFASVYRDFKDVGEFMEELKNFLK